MPAEEFQPERNMRGAVHSRTRLHCRTWGVAVGLSMRVPCEARLGAVVRHVTFWMGRGCAGGQVIVAWMVRNGVGLQRGMIYWRALCSTSLCDVVKCAPGCQLQKGLLQLDAGMQDRYMGMGLCWSDAHPLLCQPRPI